MELSVLLLTDAMHDRDVLESHFGVRLGDVHIRSLPMRVPSRLPVAVQNAVRDARHAHYIRRLAPRLLINMKFRSELPGCATKNWYYVHFPHVLGVEPRSRLHDLYLSSVSNLRRVLSLPELSAFVDTYDEYSANSQFTATQVMSRWKTYSDVIYPPCGAMTGDVAPASSRGPVIISVGRFQAYDGPDVPYKAQDFLINAFKELLGADPQAGWTLHLVGPTSADLRDQAFLDDLRESTNGLPVRFHVGVTKGELTALYGEALIYWHAQGVDTDPEAHPQAQEHFGITTVEAMAAGAIPLVYGTAGPQEVVEPVPVDLTWVDTADLVRLTVAMRSGGTDGVQASCRERASDFTDAVFASEVQRRVAHLLAPVGG